MNISLGAAQQILELDADKDARTPTQQKICSDFIYLARMTAGKPITPSVQKLDTITQVDANGFVKAVICLSAPTSTTFSNSGLVGNATAVGATALATPATAVSLSQMPVADAVAAVGGQVLNNGGTSMLVNVPIGQIETLAALPAVSTIDRYVPPHNIGRMPKKPVSKRTLRPMAPYLHKKKMFGEAILTSLGNPFNTRPLLSFLIGSPDYNGTDTGTIDQAVVCHAVPTAYSTYGVSGINSALGRRIRIGVLSDSDENLSTSQGTNDLPPTDSSTYGTGTGSSVTIVVDDTVSPAVQQDGTTEGEGTAMMEILHDMIPDAKLFFATASTSEDQFAKNILLLRFKYNCDIICDDESYFDEAVFGDGEVAQAVNQVTASGGHYFSAAGNEGHLSLYSYPNSVSGSGTETDSFTSSTWEGDFASGGTVTTIGNKSVSGSVHAYNSGTKNPYSAASYGQTYNVDAYPQDNEGSTTGIAIVQWADPPVGSTNDYDLYVTNSGGTTVSYSSTTTQNGGTSKPYEASLSKMNDRIYVLKKTAASARALHVTTYGAYYIDAPSMQFSTTGTTYGHPTTVNGFGVAAVPATTNTSYASYNPNAGSAFQSNNTSEFFSSDGPRTMFYTTTGGPNLTLAVTPTGYTLPVSAPTFTLIGTGLFAGTSSVRNQPFLAAADGVNAGSISTFSPFFGTSAATPHAAAIAGLVMSYYSNSIAGEPGLTINGGLLSVADMHTVLQNACIDIEAPGYDVTTGYGIVMPAPAIQYLTNFLPVGSITAATQSATGATIAWNTNLPAGSTVNYGTTTSLGSTATNSGDAVTSHSVALTGLQPGTLYYYQVVSATATGSASYVDPTTALHTFATSGAATQASLAVTGYSVSSASGVLTVNVTIKNLGTASASGVQVTTATLGGTSTTASLPVSVGPIAAGSSATASLTFTSPASGSVVVLRVSGSDSANDTFQFSSRITAP